MLATEISALLMNFMPGTLGIEDTTTMKVTSIILLKSQTLETETTENHTPATLGTQETDDTMTSRESLITLKRKLLKTMLRDTERINEQIHIFKLNKYKLKNVFFIF